MDEHAHRLTERVIAALDDYEGGQGTIAAVQGAVAAAASALDNAHPDLLNALRDADSHLELALFAVPPADQRAAVHRIAASLRGAIAAG
jgi:hypothetical protein